MTKAISKLIDDAKAAGLHVVEAEGVVTIRVGKSRLSVGIHIWPNGTATRSDIDLTLCDSIRGVSKMRRALGL